MSQSVLEPSSPLAPPKMTDVRQRGKFAHWHEIVLLALLTGVLAYASVTEPRFVSPGTQWDLLANLWELALLAVPMTLIILTGGIDLSVGSTMALSAVTLGLAFRHGLPISVGMALALSVGLGAGALNALFITRVKVHPLIVTLATQSAFRGIAQGVTLAEPISGFPDGFKALSSVASDGFKLPPILFAIVAVLALFVLSQTPFGLSLYGIGHNERAMRFSGWKVERAKFLLYTLMGGAAGLAAIEYVSRRNTAKADIGTGMELDVITVVVLGGTSIFGGRGSIVGTLLGLLLIHETREFVSWHWNRDELNYIVVGGLLIASVLLHSVLAKKERE